MAYPIAVDGVLEVTIEARLAGQLVMNVFHYQMQEGSTDDGEALADEFGDWFVANVLAAYTPVISQDVTDIQVYMQWILPTRFRYVAATGGPFAAGDINASLPPNDQVSITLQGEKAGRSNIGRKSCFGVPNNLVIDGLLLDPGMALYQDFADACCLWLAAVGGENLYPVILGTPEAGKYPIIRNAFPQRTIRVERRRTVGLGS